MSGVKNSVGDFVVHSEPNLSNAFWRDDSQPHCMALHLFSIPARTQKSYFRRILMDIFS